MHRQFFLITILLKVMALTSCFEFSTFHIRNAEKFLAGNKPVAKSSYNIQSGQYCLRVQRSRGCNFVSDLRSTASSSGTATLDDGMSVTGTEEQRQRTKVWNVIEVGFCAFSSHLFNSFVLAFSFAAVHGNQCSYYRL